MNEELVNGDGVDEASISKEERGLSDEAAKKLMSRLQTNDDSALEDLFRAYHKLLKAVAAKIVGMTDAEDVVMTTWIEIRKCASSYQPSKGLPLGWMIRICQWRSMDFLRQQLAKEQGHQRIEENSKQTNEMMLNGSDILDRNELKAVFALELEKLPAEQREVIHLFSQGLVQREIAKKTKTSLGTVKTRWELALAKLRKNPRITCLR